MTYVIWLALLLVTFVLVLNGFLKGARKGQVDAVLGLLLIGLVVTTSFVSGWKFGLLAIAIPFICAIITRGIAARLASRLFAISESGDSGYVGLPPRPLQRISEQLGQPN